MCFFFLFLVKVLYSNQLKNYFDDLITKVTQLKMRIENKKLKHSLSYEFESLFNILPTPHTDDDENPIELLMRYFNQSGFKLTI